VLLRVLVAADTPALATRLRRLVSGPGVSVSVRRGSHPLPERFPREDVDVVVTSLALLPEPTGTAVSFVRDLPEHPEVIVVSGAEDPQGRAALLAAGAMAVVNRNLTDTEVNETLNALLRRCREQAARRLGQAAGGRPPGLDELVAESAGMRRFIDLARRVVPTDSSLLILGETGVGKERVGRAIHADGPRASGPFIAVNCAALPESLLESELFGHEVGAFTGASRARRGYFEIAHGGTLFLDEVGEMPPHVQVKLLRALQERTIHRLGGERPIRVNVRVMAASNRDLEAEVDARRFRDDLYYRLAVVTLTIPPLRERREDIPRLVRHYLDHFRTHLGRPVRALAPEVMRAMVEYAWPGNVRELINVVERAVLLSVDGEIGLGDLPPGLTGPLRGNLHTDVLGARMLVSRVDRPWLEVKREAVAALERLYATALLQATRGKVGEAARRAGLSERALYSLMRRHGLDKRSFRPGSEGTFRSSSERATVGSPRKPLPA
jgi:two-component system response regulator AtoC